MQTSEFAVKIPTDKPYAVLELPVNDKSKPTIYAVPACTTWLKNVYIKISTEDGKETGFAGICKWPRDECKLSDYLERKKRPTDTWTTYKHVKILKLCKSIREAKEKAEKALDTSDLLSESDRGTFIKRQRFVTQRYSPSLKKKLNRYKSINDTDTDDSDVDSASDELRAPTVTNLKISGSQNNNEVSSVMSDSSDTDEETIDDIHTNQIQNILSNPLHNKSRVSKINENVNEKAKLVDRGHTKEKVTKTGNIKENAETNNQDKLMSGNENKDNSTSKSQPNLTPLHKSFSTNLLNKSPVIEIGGRTIMAAINDLRARIDTLHITVTKIYTATCSPVETPDNCIGIPSLPLISMEEFNNWENFLLEEENKLMMVRLLAEHGKDDLKSSVYGIMRKLMTNKVAVNFNFKGINREGVTIKKKKFENTSSHGLMIAALKRHKKDRNDRGLQFFYNRETADSHIGSWLKDAKKRLEIEELRLKKEQQQSQNKSDEEV